MKDLLVLYVLTRGDMPSMKFGDGYGGKAIAQAKHVGSLFAEHEIIRPLLRGEDIPADVQEWRDSTDTLDDPLGFGTCLSIEVPGLMVMEAAVEAASELGYRARLQVDPTYPLILPNEIVRLMDQSLFTAPPSPSGPNKTAVFVKETPMAYIFGEKKKLEVLLSRFKLVPND